MLDTAPVASSAGRLAGRLLAVAAMVYGTVVLGSVTPGYGPPPDRWRLWLGAVALLTATVVLGVGLRWGLRAAPWPPAVLWVLAGAVAVACIAAPVAEISFLPYVAIVAVSRALDLSSGWLLLPPVVGAQAFMMWTLGQSWQPVAGSLFASALIVAGGHLRRRRRETAELDAARAVVLARQRARAEAAEAQRDLAAQVHDVLAHSLSGLAVSLQVAALQARQEGASLELQERLAAATALAREGLAGARDAVEVLRGGASPDGAGEVTGTPDAAAADAQLASAVERFRTATGADVTLSGSLAGLDDAHRRLAEAVVREALTNSVRHAHGLPITIEASSTGVTVRTIGRPAELPATDHVSGHHGLAGLRSRVEAAGGVFVAGPDADGWAVSARWPAAGPPDR